MSTPIPQGIEVLIKKASVDPAFKAILLDHRAASADEIGLRLEPAEAMMLAATSREQLESVIARATVPQEHRRAFLGHAAATMLAALGVVVVGGGAGGLAGLSKSSDESEKGEKQKEKLTDKEKAVEKRVMEMLAKRFKVPAKELKGDASLNDDLHASASQLANLKKQLEKHYMLSISKKDFEKIKTVDDVVDCVNEAIRQRAAANPKQNPPEKLNPTRGVQPDRLMPAPGGMSPDRPTSPAPGSAAPS